MHYTAAAPAALLVLLAATAAGGGGGGGGGGGLTQCAQCFVQIQHVEVRPCLWCAHCVLHACGTWTKTITKQ